MKALILCIPPLLAVAQHSPSHHAHGTVESRGAVAMGFDQQKTAHHFILKRMEA